MAETTIATLLARVEADKKAHARRNLQHQVELYTQAVNHWTQKEAEYSSAGDDQVNNHMRVFSKKKRKKAEADLKWSQQKLKEFDGG